MSNVIAKGISSTLKETEKEVVRENIGAASQADMTAVEDDLIGTIQYFAYNTQPVGRFIKANGAAVSRTAYSKLFSRLGTTWGAGNGSTTFNVPDARGEFIRAFDDGRGVDAGRVFGSSQEDTVQISSDSIGSVIDGSNGIFNRKTTGGPFRTSGNTSRGAGQSGVNVATAQALEFNNSWSQRTSDETRPRNITLTAWIKY